MDFKEKLKGLIEKQRHSVKPTAAPESVEYEEFIGRTAVFSHQNRRTSHLEQELTPEAEQAVIDSLDSYYYELQGVDVSEEELKKFPDVSDIHVINGVRSRLRKQQAIVSRRVSNLISLKQTLCAGEMVKISEMQQEICKSVKLCSDSRISLRQGSDQFTTASLGILSNYSKRQKVSNVIDSLRTIRTLQRTDIHLQSLLKAEDYPGAIQLLLECQKAADTFKYFKCISDLSTKLQETLEMTEEQLDIALSKIVMNFTSRTYEKLFTAYGIFGRIQVMIDQLHMHFTSHIHNCAFNIILGYVELYNINKLGNDILIASFPKMQYSELCKYVNEECFLPCFLDLSKGMWTILKSYKSIRSWHEENNHLFTEFRTSNVDAEECEKYINQKFEHGVVRIWQDVQAKVKTFILAASISNFKFDDFLKVLDIINTLIDVGEAFCGSKSETLHDSIKKHSLNYFHTHHWTRMEELCMFIENEGWEICPVKSDFTATHLLEYRFLKNQSKYPGRFGTPVTSPQKSAIRKDLFDFKEEGISPFDANMDESTEEDIMVEQNSDRIFADEDSDEDVPDELKRDFVEEHTDNQQQQQHIQKKKEFTNAPIVTNTTLTILRLFGKYNQMMKLLQPIAFDVLLCSCQLFEFFFYSVFTFFSNRSIDSDFISPRLKNTLKRIESSLIFTDEENSGETTQKLPPPSLCQQILLDNPDSLYDFAVKVAAVESLAFLSRELHALQNVTERFIPSSKKGFLQQFYVNTVDMTTEVRFVVYTQVASRIIDYDGLLNLMCSVKWDIIELRSQHSSYVDILLRQLQIFTMRLEELKRMRPMPSEAEDDLWQCLIRLINRTLLEGFASAKKCSNEGRSLMQLDYQQFVIKLECLTSVRPFPERSLIETYIKAYYLPEAALEEWILANQVSYSTRQLVSLVNTMTHVSKRVRQKIANALVDETSRA